VTAPSVGGRSPRSPDRVALTRLRPERDPGVRALFLLLAVGLAFAAWKPWGGVGPGDAGASSESQTASIPAASPSGALTSDGASTADPGIGTESATCQGVGWRTFAEVHDLGFRSRMWIAMDPISGATGPGDPAIPTVPVSGERITGLGFCTDFLPHPTRTIELLGLWVIGTGRPTRLFPTVSSDLNPDEATQGVVLNPPADPGRTARPALSWASGRYAFELEIREGGIVSQAWFAVLVVQRCPAPTPTPTPTARARQTASPTSAGVSAATC
jgi:hypothetical protein